MSEDAIAQCFTRLPHAWDEGMYQTERIAICVLGGTNREWASARWRDIPKNARESIVFGFRRAVVLGTSCAAVLLETYTTERK